MSLQLKEGKMTGKEIANWLNISYDYTYRRNPQKYLEKLKEYCDYEQIRGGAIISNIRIPIYCPNLIRISIVKKLNVVWQNRTQVLLV